MIVTALLLFAIAAVGGLLLVVKHLRGQNLPLPLALIHGVVAAVGLVLLVAAAVAAGGAGALLLPVVLFVVAALGGFYLFGRHLRGKRLPTAGVFVHAGVAVIAFLLLLAIVVKAGK